MTTGTETPAPRTKGLVMHSEARYYDLLAWLLTFGRERAFRERLVELARVQPGDAVLDVGCGTGTLAVAAKRRVGTEGIVHGVDASPEMIERAKRKAEKAGVEVIFQTAVVETLPFPDASFDVVLSTLMLHHLPRGVREQCAREIHRVLRPGGRVLAVDFATPVRDRKGLVARFHRHGHMALDDISRLLLEAGLAVIESGSVGVSDLHFVLATAPGSDGSQRSLTATMPGSRGPLPTPRWVFALLVAAVLALHAVVVEVGWARVTLPGLVIVTIIGLLMIAHLGSAEVIHALLRRRSPE
jgi:Methylase involved in ubiquinone/menaquinone biosynthesis